ncbi:hypothetical protein [Romboutsia ilealis]|uniref:hypothetical protein n=1 Tax=Romboutsia ilealis TaxID=1115758 RepID=UPI0023F26798|nr:hypothetical protein [Romboutsia ilealis]
MLNRRCKSYTFAEYRTSLQEDYSLAEKMLNHMKENKVMYTRLVVITALILHFNINFVFANEVGASLDATFNQLIELLKEFAKWGCLGMGLKKLVEEMLSGASFKQASVGGIQYWLCYIFIQFYPKLFDMIKM